jgi:hypothetical protein
VKEELCTVSGNLSGYPVIKRRKKEKKSSINKQEHDKTLYFYQTIGMTFSFMWRRSIGSLSTRGIGARPRGDNLGHQARASNPASWPEYFHPRNPKNYPPEKFLLF